MSRNRREAAIAAHTTDFSSLREGREEVVQEESPERQQWHREKVA